MNTSVSVEAVINESHTETVKGQDSKSGRSSPDAKTSSTSVGSRRQSSGKSWQPPILMVVSRHGSFLLITQIKLILKEWVYYIYFGYPEWMLISVRHVLYYLQAAAKDANHVPHLELRVEWGLGLFLHHSCNNNNNNVSWHLKINTCIRAGSM